jgi:tetratricopeptide (TPR) repeat protein
MIHFFNRIILSLGISAIALSLPAIAIPVQDPPPNPIPTPAGSEDLSSQSRILLARGQSLYQLGRYAEALSAIDKVLAAHPRHIAALELRGDSLQKLERYQESLQSYDQALALLGDQIGEQAENPERDEAIATLWTERARVLANLNRYEESVSSYDTALERRCVQRVTAKEPLPEVCQVYSQPRENSPQSPQESPALW